MISPSPPAPAAAPSSAAAGTRSPCHSEESKHTTREDQFEHLEDTQTHNPSSVIHPSQLRKRQIKRGADTEDNPCDTK